MGARRTRRGGLVGRAAAQGASLFKQGWDKFHPRFDGWSVALEGATVSLYGDRDTMLLQATL